MNKPLAYLACAYSANTKEEREQNFKRANKAAAKLMKEGKIIFSPISHTHPITVQENLPAGWEFWEKFDRAFLSCCNKMYVLPGWENSKGVAAEIKIAEELKIPIVYL